MNSSTENPQYGLFRSTIGEKYVIFFMGDFVVNKCQHQIIDVFFALKTKGISNIILILAGKIVDSCYKDFVERHVSLMGLNNEVLIIKEDFDLYLNFLYSRADLYLSLSEDGNDIGIFEAIKYNIPTLFYEGIKVNKNSLPVGKLKLKAPTKVAEKIEEVMENSHARTILINAQYKAFLQFKESCSHSFPLKTHHPISFDVRMDGPCDSTYSLALVNQELGRALINKRKKVAFFATEGPGDYAPNKLFLQSHKTILSHLVEEPVKASMVVRNLYPPRVSSMGGIVKILGPYGWEESVFPEHYIQNFNRRLSGIACMSSYVAKVLSDNGVKIPLYITGIGADHILRYSPKPLPIDLPKNLKLLHISSCFPRKGVDVLLQAIEIIPLSLSLIVKSFPNPHNTLRKDLIKAGWEAMTCECYVKKDKTVILIESDLTMGQMRTLYESCNMLVAPSRGEGFGLPMAEAMLLGVPVITTAYGGQTDFCTPDTTWLIDYTFAPAQTHLSLLNSIWVEPSLDDLVHQIMIVAHASEIERNKKIEQARKIISSHFTWENVAQKMIDFRKRLILK